MVKKKRKKGTFCFSAAGDQKVECPRFWPDIAESNLINAEYSIFLPNPEQYNTSHHPFAITFTTVLQVRPVPATPSDRSILPPSFDRWNPSGA